MKTFLKTITSCFSLRLHFRKLNRTQVWALTLKKGTVEYLKIPQIILINNYLNDSCSVRDNFEIVPNRTRCVISGSINCIFKYLFSVPPRPTMRCWQIQADNSMMLTIKPSDPRSILNEGNNIFLCYYFLSFFFVVKDRINKCFVFLLFRSLYAHFPHRNRASTTSVSVKSTQSLHEVKICSPHRFYDSWCSHFH